MTDENQIYQILIILTGITSIVFIALYCFKLHYETEGIRIYEKEKKRDWSNILLLLAAALLVKLVFAAMYEGHGTDMNCFYVWSDMIFKNGIGRFYSLEGLTDYPPGYMTVLWVIAAIRHLFSIETVSSLGRVLIKLVPVLSDVAAGVLLYILAKKKFSEGSSLLLSVTYVLNPIVVLDSSIWGQTDGVFTFFVLLTCYLCMEEKRIPAYFSFVIGVLFKPQMLIFTPILIWSIVEQVLLRKPDLKKIGRELTGGLSAIAAFFLLILPFGIGKVMGQYVATLGSYKYCTINAYNLWALFGKNWSDQSGEFLGIPYYRLGTLAIVMAVVLSGFVFFRLKEDKSRYFISMSVVVSTMFLFSVRMHERYLFPVVVLTLAAFLMKPTAELFFTYVGYSIVQILNVTYVLYHYVEYESTGPTGGILGITALLTFGVYLYMMFWGCFSKSGIQEMKENIRKKKNKNKQRNYIVRSQRARQKETVREEKSPIRASKKMPALTKWDWIVLLGIMLFYSLFAFHDLGNDHAPQTEWAYSVNDEQGNNTDNTIVLDLGKEEKIDMLYTYLGNYENREFNLDLSQDGEHYERVGVVQANSVFSWNTMRVQETDNDSYNLVKTYRYIRLEATNSESVLRELVIRDDSGEFIMPVNAGEYPQLFDEQEEYEEIVTFRSGTYFDEIYHARTAYEMQKKLYCYENTHPPFGKFLISIGIRIFGMNPFGWRIIGTLFGIFMLPFMYFFGRRLFDGRTWAAGALTFLFAFDFMHFTQTRIATIDVYGTFFIIAMYFFMYWYSQTSFYDSPLLKTFIPLGLSAIMMGLGCAAKWTAVYAAAGLAIFFGAVMLKRYLEYRTAKKTPKDVTEGISHAHIVEVYKKYVAATLGFCVVFFLFIAGGIYLLSYGVFSDGAKNNTDRFAYVTDTTFNPNCEKEYTETYRNLANKLKEKKGKFGNLLGKMVKNQHDMYVYHSQLESSHPFESKWYQWPTMTRPMFYYSQTLEDGRKEGISAFGNPLVWWAGIPALLFMIYLIISERDPKALVLAFSYFVQYVPWMKVAELRCTFIYHYFPCVPFVAMMIVYIMVRLVKKDRKWFKWCMIYLAAAFLLFCLFYPVLSGEPVEATYVRDGLKWMSGWTLVS